MLTDAFLSSLGLQLVGPYDVLAGKTKTKTRASRGGGRPNYLLHWRYYFDPPEFLTVVRSDDNKQFHIGYYRYLLTTSHPVVLFAAGFSDASEGLPTGMLKCQISRKKFVCQFLALFGIILRIWH